MGVVRHNNIMGVVCNYFKRALIAPDSCRSAFQFKQSQDINFYVSLFNNKHATNVMFYYLITCCAVYPVFISNPGDFVVTDFNGIQHNSLVSCYGINSHVSIVLL